MGRNKELVSVLVLKVHLAFSEASRAFIQEDTSTNSSAGPAALEKSRKSVLEKVGKLFLIVSSRGTPYKLIEIAAILHP